MSTFPKPETVVTDTTPQSFLSQLKTATEAEHRALEATELSQLVMSPALTLDNYLKVLYAFYGAFLPIEKKIDQGLQRDSVDLNSPNRAALAADDIRFLSGRFDEGMVLNYDWNHNGMPSNDTLPSLPVTLGMLYVLEGSKLGGRLISRQLSRTLGISPDEGGRFFGTGEIEDWRKFQQYCTNYVQQHPDQASIVIESAKNTFKSIKGYFERVLSAPN